MATGKRERQNVMIRINTELQYDTAMDLKHSEAILQEVALQVLSCAAHLEDTSTVFERTAERLVGYSRSIEREAKYSQQLWLTLEKLADKYEACERMACQQAYSFQFDPPAAFPIRPAENPFLDQITRMLFTRPAALLRTMWVTEYPAHEPFMFRLLTDGMWPVEPQGRIDPNQLQYLFEENIFTMLR